MISLESPLEMDRTSKGGTGFDVQKQEQSSSQPDMRFQKESLTKDYRMKKNNQTRPFEIRSSPIQGQGVFATRTIQKGARIIEYLGERITHDEADQRYDDETGMYAHVLLFSVNEKTVIDAGVGGNEAKYINHSCEPNCEAVNESGHVFIEALHTIMPGEELTFDYQLERPGEYDPEWEELYACHCGATSCRGTLLAPLANPENETEGE